MWVATPARAPMLLIVIVFQLEIIASLSSSGTVDALHSPPRPHIVFLFCDNVGWSNVGYHRRTPTNEVATPRIDALARTGLELDRMYTYKFCSPSRSSLLSGATPSHPRQHLQRRPSAARGRSACRDDFDQREASRSRIHLALCGEMACRDGIPCADASWPRI